MHIKGLRWSDIIVILLLGVMLLELLKGLFSLFALEGVIAAIILVALIVSIPRVKPSSRYLCLILLSLGITIYMIEDLESYVLIPAIQNTLKLFLLFFVAGFAAIPIQLGGYPQYLQDTLFSRVSSNPMKLLIINLFCYILSLFAIIGSFITSYELIRKAVQQLTNEPEKVLAQSITRGLALSCTWTPIAASVATAIHYTGVSWLELVPYGIVVSLVGLIVSVSIQTIKQPWRISEVSWTAKNPFNVGKAIELIVAFFFLSSLIMLLQKYFRLNIFYAVTLAALLMAVLWPIYLGQAKSLKSKFLSVTYASAKSQLDTFVVFVGAGFFASLAGKSIFVTALIKKVMETSFAWDGLPVMLPLAIWGLALIGINPVIGIVLIGESLDLTLLSVDPMALALIIVVASGIGSMSSPFMGATLLTSALTGRSSWEIGFRLNGLYSLLYLFMSFLLIRVLIY